MQDSRIDELEKEIEELKTCKENLLKELNEEATSKALDLKGHQRRETALVNTLAEKNEEIEKLKELNEYLRNQLRMKTDMLKATELKIEEDSKTKDAEIERLNRYSKNLDKVNHDLVPRVILLESENERLKTEVKEALAKRDYYQDLANKEAADAKKAEQDYEKEMEWQRNKLQEFDYVLTKYRAKIKELEDANRFSELVINLIIKE